MYINYNVYNVYTLTLEDVLKGDVLVVVVDLRYQSEWWW